MGHEEEEVLRRRQEMILVKSIFVLVGVCACALLVVCLVVGLKKQSHDDDYSWVEKLDIELVSMDFTVLNITQTTTTHRLSAKWDLSIRIPNFIPGYYICLQGDLEASILYKQNITLATSQKYNHLIKDSSQLLKISAVQDIIGKDIVEDIKEKKEVRFGSQLFFPDCRRNAAATMSFICNEATLRFQPGSEMKATLFGNYPTCISPTINI